MEYPHPMMMMMIAHLLWIVCSVAPWHCAPASACSRDCLHFDKEKLIFRLKSILLSCSESLKQIHFYISRGGPINHQSQFTCFLISTSVIFSFFVFIAWGNLQLFNSQLSLFSWYTDVNLFLFLVKLLNSLAEHVLHIRCQSGPTCVGN